MILPAVLGARGPAAPLRILCLGAHCDDIEIGCGGTVMRLLHERPGSSVTWVALSSTPEREREARGCAEAMTADAARRDIVIKAFRDGYFPFLGTEIKDCFETEVKKAAGDPELILTHHRADRHQDHRMVAELTWNTFRNHVILEYEIPKYEGDLGLPNLFVPLPEATARRKIELLIRYFQSQGSKRWFRAENFEAVLRLRGLECNAPDGLAEAFHASKLVM